MKHIFISHAGEDAAVADRLAKDLRNAGHEIKVDTQELKLGSDFIEFMDQGISNAHAVIILHSRSTLAATWQKLEIKSALWREVQQGSIECIVIKLDDTSLPTLLSHKVCGELNLSDSRSYQQLLEKLCKAILPEKTSSSIVWETARENSINPFRRVRAEYLENPPDLLAKIFAPPDAFKMGALEDMKPCFLEGSRGTGKSMLLLSLRARNFFSRHKEKTFPHIFGGSVCQVVEKSKAFP